MKLLKYVGMGIIFTLYLSAVFSGIFFLLLGLSHVFGDAWTFLVTLSFVGALCGIFVYLVEET